MPVWKPDCLRPNYSLHGGTEVHWPIARADDDNVAATLESYTGTAVLELNRVDGASLGIVVSGGSDKSCCPYISTIKPGGIAFRTDSLQEGDCILSINAIRARDLKHDEVVNVLKNATERVLIEIEYQIPREIEPSSGVVFKKLEVVLVKDEGGFGFIVRGGAALKLSDSTPHIVTGIRTGSPAHRNGCIHIGDHLRCINHLDICNLTLTEVMTYLRQCHNTATFTFSYQTSVMDEVSNARGALRIEIDKSRGRLFGVELKEVNVDGQRIVSVSQITPASIADRCGALHVKDRLLSIDGVGIEAISLAEATDRLNSSDCDVVTIEVLPVNVHRRQPSTSSEKFPAESSDSAQSKRSPVGAIERTGQVTSLPGTQSMYRQEPRAFSYDTLTQRSVVRRKIDARRGGDHMSVMSLVSTTASVVTNINQICRSEVAVVSLQLEGQGHAVPGGGVGLVVETGGDSRREFGAGSHLIVHVEPDSAADRSGVIQAGDHLIKVNGQSVVELPASRVTNILREVKGACVLEVEFDVAESVQPSSGTFTVKLPPTVGGLGLDVSAIGKPPSKRLLIRKVKRGSPAYRCGSIQSGDQILSINDVSASQMSPNDAARMLAVTSHADIVKLKLRREDHSDISSSVVYSVELERVSEGLGLKLTGSSDHHHPIIVSSVTRGGLAERTGLIHSGDQVLAINGVCTQGLNLYESMELLEQTGDTVYLKLSKAIKSSREGNSRRDDSRKSATPQPSGDSAMESWDSSGCDRPPVIVNKKSSRARDKNRRKPPTLPLSYQDLGTTTDSMCNLIGVSNLAHVQPTDETNAEWLKALADMNAVEHVDLMRQLGGSGSRSGSRHDTMSDDDRDGRNGQGQGRDSRSDKPSSYTDSSDGGDCIQPTMNLYRMRLERSTETSDYGFCVSDAVNERSVYISAVRVGGLAHSAGLQPYDRLLQVNGMKYRELTSKRAVEMMRHSLYIDIIVCRAGRSEDSGSSRSVDGQGHSRNAKFEGLGVTKAPIAGENDERTTRCGSSGGKNWDEACSGKTNAVSGRNDDFLARSDVRAGHAQRDAIIQDVQQQDGEKRLNLVGGVLPVECIVESLGENMVEAGSVRAEKNSADSFLGAEVFVDGGGVAPSCLEASDGSGKVFPTNFGELKRQCGKNRANSESDRARRGADRPTGVGVVNDEAGLSMGRCVDRCVDRCAICASGGEITESVEDEECKASVRRNGKNDDGCSSNSREGRVDGRDWPGVENMVEPVGKFHDTRYALMDISVPIKNRAGHADVANGGDEAQSGAGVCRSDGVTVGDQTGRDIQLLDSNMAATPSLDNNSGGNRAESLMGDGSISLGMSGFIEATRQLYRSSTPKVGGVRGGVWADGRVGGEQEARAIDRIDENGSNEGFSEDGVQGGENCARNFRSYDVDERKCSEKEIRHKSRRRSCVSSREGVLGEDNWRNVQEWRQQHCVNFESPFYGTGNVHSM